MTDTRALMDSRHATSKGGARDMQERVTVGDQLDRQRNLRDAGAPRPNEYETQITAWFLADNAEDAVAIADRLADRLRDHPPPNVRVVTVITRPIGTA